MIGMRTVRDRGPGHAVRLAALLAALLAAMAGAAPAEAGCVRRIVNRSSVYAVVSRDGGPAVTIPPHRSQAIRYEHPGSVAVALTCAPPAFPGNAPEAPVYQASYGYEAMIDRCYIKFGDGFFERQLGPGFVGTTDTRPLTLNNPNQGDIVVGPAASAQCPLPMRGTVRARY